jgi:uncharacterized protein YggE
VKRTAAVVLVVVLVAVGAFFVGGGRATKPAAAADAPSASSGVVVDGLGKVFGTPDVLRSVFGVSLRRDDVSTALQDANTLQNRVRGALKKSGVAGADLQTSAVNVSPSYDRKGRRNGYQVSETLTAKLRDLAKAGRAISDAVVAGGSAVVLQGVSFALEDNVALLAKARDAAYAAARAKAQRYAELSGRRLGAVQLVTEKAPAPQNLPQYMGFARTALDGLSPVPIDPGTSQVSVSVTVRWALA